MLISVEKLIKIWNVNPNGILHVGAHLAEEESDYVNHGWHGTNGIYWVEAQPSLVSVLKSKLDPDIHKVFGGVVWGENGIKMNFNVTSNSQSSSVLDFGSHAETYPNISVVSMYEVESIRLDSLLPEAASFDFIALDIQGAELEALKGLGKLMNNINWIYSEVNKKEVYRNCATIDQIDEYLGELGFQRVATRWAFRSGWGDALWMKRRSVWWAMPRIAVMKIDNGRMMFLYVYRYFRKRLKGFATR